MTVSDPVRAAVVALAATWKVTAPLPDDLEAVIAELVPPDQIEKVFAREPVDDHDE